MQISLIWETGDWLPILVWLMAWHAVMRMSQPLLAEGSWVQALHRWFFGLFLTIDPHALVDPTQHITSSNYNRPDTRYWLTIGRFIGAVPSWFTDQSNLSHDTCLPCWEWTLYELPKIYADTGSQKQNTVTYMSFDDDILSTSMTLGLLMMMKTSYDNPNILYQIYALPLL